MKVFNSRGQWSSVQKKTKGPLIKTIKITPEIAQKLLDKSSTINRNLRRDRIRKYAMSMINNEWETVNPIHFDARGYLRDGYHRLNSVIEADTTVEFIVHFGVTNKEVASIDEGRSRSTLDVMRLTGLNVSNIAVQACAYMLEYSEQKRATPRSQEIQFYKDNAEAAEWVAERIKGKKYRSNCVASVLVRAYYHCKDDTQKLKRLERFIEIYQGTDYPRNEHERAAFVLHNHFVSCPRRNGSQRKDLTKAAAWCLERFLKDEKASRVGRVAPEKVFPLPIETKYGSIKDYIYQGITNED